MPAVRTLREYLEEARARPGMFSSEWSLEDLQSQCHGWSAALAAHGIDEFGTGFNARFRDWLRSTKGLSIARGWAQAIRSECASDEEAWRRFFDLFDEFCAS